MRKRKVRRILCSSVSVVLEMRTGEFCQVIGCPEMGSISNLGFVLYFNEPMIYIILHALCMYCIFVCIVYVLYMYFLR